MTDTINRRKFLQSTGFLGMSVAAATGLSACGNSSPSDINTPAATGHQWKFPQSIASGDPRADGIILWTRVVPMSADAVSSSDAAPFSIQLHVTLADNSAALGSNTALTGTLVVNDTLTVTSTHDHSVRQKITGLTAASVYYYQFVAGDVRSNVGRFKTAPAATATPAQLDFAVLTCQDWSVNHWAVYDSVKNEALDFFIHLGDYIYETVGEDFQTGAVESRHDALVLPNGTFKTGNSGAKYASTLADYRYLYKKYRTDSRLQAVHERFAMVAIWDDHEFSDDCWMDAETYDNGTLNGNTHQPMRRRQANQAWFEFMPADVTFDASNGSGFNNVKLYRDLQFGTLAHLIMTDERLYRNDHVIAEANLSNGAEIGQIGSRYMVPETTFNVLEAQKASVGTSLTGDPLFYLSMLGQTQRDWWKTKMSQSSATWKLWGNEVSLLKMGIDGTAAIATLLALNSISTLASNIGNTIALTNGNVPVAAAIVAAATAGASTAIAGAAGQAIAVAVATSADPATAAVTAGLTAAQAGIAVAAFNAAATSSAAGVTGQVTSAAQTIAFGYIKPDIIAHGAASPFVIAAGQATALGPFFAKFLLNADQWDGYNAERKDLMKHLKDHSINNVVAFTGDIHSFFAGQVMDDFSATSPTPVMVDLVTAGVSSDSFFSYLKSAVSSLSDSLSTLIYYPLTIPLTGLGSITVNVNLLNYTMGKDTPMNIALATSLTPQIREQLGKLGVPESNADLIMDSILVGIINSVPFNTELLPLVQQLAGLNNNPWLKHINTDAQGYSRITLTADKVDCQFRQINRLMGSNAPNVMMANTTQVTVAAGSVLPVVSETLRIPVGLFPLPDQPVDNCSPNMTFC
ncbi:MAG: hypothetical protein RL180_1541 [Pseudomonadota bacterium]